MFMTREPPKLPACLFLLFSQRISASTKSIDATNSAIAAPPFFTDDDKISAAAAAAAAPVTTETSDSYKQEENWWKDPWTAFGGDEEGEDDDQDYFNDIFTESTTSEDLFMDIDEDDLDLEIPEIYSQLQKPAPLLEETEYEYIPQNELELPVSEEELGKEKQKGERQVGEKLLEQDGAPSTAAQRCHDDGKKDSQGEDSLKETTTITQKDEPKDATDMVQAQDEGAQFTKREKKDDQNKKNDNTQRSDKKTRTSKTKEHKHTDGNAGRETNGNQRKRQKMGLLSRFIKRDSNLLKVKQQSEATTRTATASFSISSFATASLPKLGSFLDATRPWVKILALVGVGKALLGSLMKRFQHSNSAGSATKSSSKNSKFSSKTSNDHDQKQQFETQQPRDDNDGNDNYEDEDDLRYRDVVTIEKVADQRRHNDVRATSSSSSVAPGTHRPYVHQRVTSSDIEAYSGPFRKQRLMSAFLPSLRNRGGEDSKLPPARELMDRLNALQIDAQVAIGERQKMEQEYEKASWELQEARTELATLASTTRYLKAQLSDNQEVIERTIQSERRRARDELGRMKEAMLQVLHKERQALRRKLMKQNAQVQAILEERQQQQQQQHQAGTTTPQHNVTKAISKPPIRQGRWDECILLFTHAGK